MIKINIENERLFDELLYVVKLFYTADEIESLDIEFNVFQTCQQDTIYTKVTSNLNGKQFEKNGLIRDENFPERYLKRYAKLALFDCIQDLFPHKILPWGSLTGIRPTKLFYELIKEHSGNEQKAFDEFINEFKVTKQ